MTVEFEAVDPQHDDALALLRQAAEEARALYPEHFAPDAPWPGNPPAGPRLRQAPAMALYQACGFRAIDAFGPYAGDPTSRCFEKVLSP